MPAVAVGVAIGILRRTLTGRTGSREPVREDLLVETPALSIGLPRKLPSKICPEQVVLVQSLIPPPTQGVQAYESGVSPFVGWLLGYHPFHRLDRRFIVRALLVQSGHLQEQ